MGNRAATIHAAVARLDAREGVSVSSVSDLYETQPRMVVEQPDFLNACVEVQTTLDAKTLLDVMLEIEREFGRVRTAPKGPRPIDLDLLLYGSEVIEVEGLRVPHPGLPERAFVLVPLAQIAAGVEHPGLGETIGRLRDACVDAGWVRRVVEPVG